MALKRSIIERDILGIGTFEREQLRAATAKSNETLRRLASEIQWTQSYAADDKTFCVCLARDEDMIRKHAKNAGLPATKITPGRHNNRSDYRKTALRTAPTSSTNAVQVE